MPHSVSLRVPWYDYRTRERRLVPCLGADEVASAHVLRSEQRRYVLRVSSLATARGAQEHDAPEHEGMIVEVILLKWNRLGWTAAWRRWLGDEHLRRRFSILRTRT